MDNVTGISGYKNVAPQQRSNKSKGVQFKAAFNEVVDNQEPSKTEKPTLGALGELRAMAPPIMDGTWEGITQKSDELLSLVDSYAGDLANSGKSLKEIAPLIGSIKEKADQLLKDAELSSQEHPQLKELAERSALLANVEYMKFNRGDYA